MRHSKRTIPVILTLVAASAASLWGAGASIFINFPSISPDGDGIKDEMTVSVYLPSPADTLIVTVRDRLSPEVYDTLMLKAPADTGYHNEVWDGSDWTGTVLPEGQYDLHVYETAGGTPGELNRTVVVDLTSPQVSIDRIEPGVFSPGWPDTSAAVRTYFTVTGWEAGAAARMTVRSPSGTGTTSSVGVTGDGEWTAVWKPATAATGYHTIFITVEDEAGNSESDSGTVFVDSDGPVIQIVTSVPSNTRQAPEEIIGRAWDESGVTSMELTWAGPDLQESARFAPDSTWDEADTLYWRFDTPDSVNGGADYVEGGYILKAFAGDQFGNEKSRQVSFKLDRTAPAPPVISAVPARMIQPQLDLYIEFQTGTDTLFVYRNAGGTTWATKFITAGHEPGDPFEVTLEAGQNEFQAEAKDKAGNISALSNTVSTVLDPATGINYPEVFRGPGVFQVVSERTAWSVTVEIFDMRGDRIRKLTATGPGTSFDIGWDLTTDDGEEVNNGACLVMITINSEGGRTVDKAFIAVVR